MPPHPLTDWGHIIIFCPVRLSVCPQKTLMLVTTFEIVIKFSYFLCVVVGVRPFLWYQGQVPLSRSNIKVSLFSSHEHGVLSELLWSLTVRWCPSGRPSIHPSIHNLLVNTLASTNINQSSPNLVKMYMATRARMSPIMEPIGPKLSELSALEFENLPYLTMFTL